MKCLITGASSGIGKVMASTLYNLGHEVILVSKDKTKLESVSKELKGSSYYLCDLSNEEETDLLCKFILKEKPDIVINDAGFGAFGDYKDVPLEKEMSMINVNVISLHKITKTCLKYMERDNYIMNVASIAGLLPGGPLLGTYYATKSYVRSYTLGIYEELRRNKSKVNISLLCPGPVNTNFNKVAGGHFSINSKTSDFVGNYAIKKMFKKKLIIIPGLDVKLGFIAGKILPVKLVLKILYKIEHKKGEIK